MKGTRLLKSLISCFLIGAMSLSTVACVENSTGNVEGQRKALEAFVDTAVAYKEVCELKAHDEYGNTFTYVVKNSSGQSVELYNYTFVVEENSPYKVIVTCGKEKKEYTLTPKDMSAPIIYVHKDIQRINVLNGEKASYPTVTAFDNVDGEVAVSYSVSYQGETYEGTSDGFTPTEIGYYELTISAKDSANNIAEKKVVYEAVATIEETYKVFAFDEEALRYIDWIGGRSNEVLEYNTDENYVYGNEKGSTHLSCVAAGTPLFVVKNQLIDTSSFDSIRFYVYNANKFDIYLAPTVYTMYLLKAGEWTEVVIEKWDSVHTPDMDHSDITGMCFMLSRNNEADNAYGYEVDLYFSAAYGVIK